MGAVPHQSTAHECPRTNKTPSDAKKDGRPPSPPPADGAFLFLTRLVLAHPRPCVSPSIGLAACCSAQIPAEVETHDSGPSSRTANGTAFSPRRTKKLAASLSCLILGQDPSVEGRLKLRSRRSPATQGYEVPSLLLHDVQHNLRMFVRSQRRECPYLLRFVS